MILWLPFHFRTIAYTFWSCSQFLQLKFISEGEDAKQMSKCSNTPYFRVMPPFYVLQATYKLVRSPHRVVYISKPAYEKH